MHNEANKNQETSELEKQLHEQYTIINNSNVSGFVAFMTAILALLGAFGYTFTFSSNHCVS